MNGLRVAGFDVGGANLKLATSDGLHCLEKPFPLWKKPGELADELGGILQSVPGITEFAVTMTGELADCFATKRDGVCAIVDALLKVAVGRPVSVWSTAGCFVSPEEACADPMRVASANWHALASFWARQHSDERGVVIDIGSTTTDVIPYANGACTAIGKTDLGRLQAGELIYRGVRRTPVCAISRTVPLRGCELPLAAEVFATTYDLFLIRGDLPEDTFDRETANGQPATVACAIDRLTRQLCCDRFEIDGQEIRAVATYLIGCLVREIEVSLGRVALDEGQVLVCGAGAFLAREAIRKGTKQPVFPIRSLSDEWGPVLSQGACAFAVARMKAGLNSF